MNKGRVGAFRAFAEGVTLSFRSFAQASLLAPSLAVPRHGEGVPVFPSLKASRNFEDEPWQRARRPDKDSPFGMWAFWSVAVGATKIA